MSYNIVEFPQSEEPDDDHFGVCPKCKKYSGCLNIGRDHWFYCDAHKTKWWIGSNLFSGWKTETKEEHYRNAGFLSNYADMSGRPTYSEEPPDHRETEDNYRGEIFRRGEYRVILCKDGIQWIVQRRRKGAAARWLALGYCTTRAALARLWSTYYGEDAAEISALPETVRRAK